ncbi:MAG: DUF6011 domain-containing protein [Candidatus Thorarchaeota archaeon]
MTFPRDSHRISTEDAARFIFAGKAEFTIDRRRQGKGHEAFFVSTEFDGEGRPEVAFVKDCTKTFIGHITFKRGWPEFVPAGRKHFSEWGAADRARRNERAGLIKWVVQVIAHWQATEPSRDGTPTGRIEFAHDDTPDFVHHGKCGMCHRQLSDPASIGRGLGPICAKIVNER